MVPRRPSARAFDSIMTERLPEPLQKKIADWLRFYDDLGIRLFYRDRSATPREVSSPITYVSSPSLQEEPTLPRPARKPELQKAHPVTAPKPAPPPLPLAAGPSLFDAA